MTTLTHDMRPYGNASEYPNNQPTRKTLQLQFQSRIDYLCWQWANDGGAEDLIRPNGSTIAESQDSL